VSFAIRLRISGIDVICLSCGTREISLGNSYGNSIALTIRSFDLSERAREVQAHSLQDEISAINELFSIKNGGTF
jgi:hypothetical protein